jgi:arginyl-tRNA synthetase
VTREYYFNNAGRQMRVLGETVKLRVQELLGETVEIPEDYYQGEYLVEIAQSIVDEHGSDAASNEWEFFKDIAEAAIFADIKTTLLRLGIEFDSFVNEADFFANNAVWDLLDKLREKGMIYDKDDAVWYKATEFGADKDRVFVRSTGEPTYRLPDVAYHVNKLDRGFERVINVLGADHSAQTPDIKSAVSVLGYDPDRIEPLIYQFVTLTSGGEAVKMSTRKANFVTLDELIDEVGTDAVRYFMISRSTDSQMEFDLELAKSQSKDNPVFYIQYAHTRIASIVRELDADSVGESTDLSPLTEPESLTLIKKLDAFEDALTESVRHMAPHIVATYAHQLAGIFHTFYENHRVLVDDESVSQARLALVKATQIVLKSALHLLGVSAPERM